LLLLLSPAILNDTEGIFDSPDNVYQKFPYDNVAMSVERINSFRKGDSGRGAVLLTRTKTHALLPETIASTTTKAFIERTCFPIRKSG
jgi:hypothetical protein